MDKFWLFAGILPKGLGGVFMITQGLSCHRKNRTALEGSEKAVHWVGQDLVNMGAVSGEKPDIGAMR